MQRFITLLITIGLILLGAYLAYNTRRTVTYTAPIAITPRNADLGQEMAIPKQDKLDVWLDKLAQAESGGKSWLKHFDSNKVYSYGAFQWQYKSLVHYAHKYHMFTDMPDSELLNVAYDYDMSKQLARVVIEREPEGWRNWFNSVVYNVGKPPIYEVSLSNL